MAVLENTAVPATTGVAANDVAVVIVVRDQVALTLRALTGLAKPGQGPRFDTIVVDDGSQDSTPALLAGVEGDFTGLREQTPRGFAAGCDRAVAACAAAVIVVIREDLITTAGWLDGLLASVSDPGVGAALPRVLDVAGRDVKDPGWPCLAIRREVLSAVGGFQGAAQPSRAVKTTLLEAIEAAGWNVADVPSSVLLALPDAVAAR